MKKLFFALFMAAVMWSCGTTRQAIAMDTLIGRYNNGYLLDTDWEVIGYARGGYLLDENYNVVGRYNNGYAYDCLDSLIAVYDGRGFIYSDRSLWELYDKMDLSAYIKEQRRLNR